MPGSAASNNINHSSSAVLVAKSACLPVFGTVNICRPTITRTLPLPRFVFPGVLFVLYWACAAIVNTPCVMLSAAAACGDAAPGSVGMIALLPLALLTNTWQPDLNQKRQACCCRPHLLRRVGLGIGAFLPGTLSPAHQQAAGRTCCATTAQQEQMRRAAAASPTPTPQVCVPTQLPIPACR